MICIGSVSIKNVSGSANVQFGNIVNQSPISSTKTTTGAGAENEGMLIITSSGFSLTTTIPILPSITPSNPLNSITSGPKG